MSAPAVQMGTVRKMSAVLWVIMALLGAIVSFTALGLADPIEPEDWLAECALLVGLVAFPAVIAWRAHRTRIAWLSSSLLLGAVLWPAALYWIVIYG